jgi:16S rRNA (guanine(1405)-N(7))-methyltransferase
MSDAVTGAAVTGAAVTGTAVTGTAVTGTAASRAAVIQAAVERLRAAPKYRQIHRDTIADIVEREAANGTSDADLERHARLKLHKVIADYLLVARPSRLLRGLDEAVAAGPDALRDWCRAVLARHFSTAERLPGLDRLYPAILDLTGPASSIADLACALNPFSVPWLRAATSARYVGYDLNMRYVELGAGFLRLTDPTSVVRHCDVLVRPEEIRADVALLLKTYHCIEDRRSGAALSLVQDLAAAQVVVSFPVRTMSGRIAPFTRRHLERLAAMAERRGWAQRRASLGDEDLVVIDKGDGRGQRG